MEIPSKIEKLLVWFAVVSAIHQAKWEFIQSAQTFRDYLVSIIFLFYSQIYLKWYFWKHCVPDCLSPWLIPVFSFLLLWCSSNPAFQLYCSYFSLFYPPSESTESICMSGISHKRSKQEENYTSGFSQCSIHHLWRAEPTDSAMDPLSYG